MQLELRRELYKLLGKQLLIAPSDRASLAMQYLAHNSECEDKSTYNERVLKLNCEALQPETQISISHEYDINTPNTIAIYAIQDFITWDSWWWYSTKDLISNLKEAEANPNIIAHFIYIDSPGGEAYGLNTLNETIRSLEKPVVALCSQCMCSAAYYSACSADKIFASNKFDEIGSIGTMCVVYNEDEYWESIGIKKQDIYATKSTLKNKVYKDAKEGNPQELIEKFLDPFQLQFEMDVKIGRPFIVDSEDSGVFKGETYYADKALELGLIDGIMTFEQAIQECLNLVEQKKNLQFIQSNIINDI